MSKMFPDPHDARKEVLVDAQIRDAEDYALDRAKLVKELRIEAHYWYAQNYSALTRLLSRAADEIERIK